jgi:hypothetical protein
MTFPNASDVGETVTSAVPPVRAIANVGLLIALLLMVSVALLVAVDVYVTLIEQVAFGAKPKPRIGQVVVRVKAVGFVPPSAMLLIVRAKFPVFFTVIVCGVLFVNDRLVGVALITAPVPVPLREIVWEPVEEPLSDKVIAALRAPTVSGLNVTLNVQLAPAAKPVATLGQLLVVAKSPAFAPPSDMLEM